MKDPLLMEFDWREGACASVCKPGCTTFIIYFYTIICFSNTEDQSICSLFLVLNETIVMDCLLVGRFEPHWKPQSTNDPHRPPDEPCVSLA